ncbi:MAG: sigma-54-dependent Fis family transcriptional regulator [Planctomycetes bacterium]|nr:sigma-54-dependent Fis family transcriptional regulator [Planctomycetota bacterium]
MLRTVLILVDESIVASVWKEAFREAAGDACDVETADTIDDLISSIETQEDRRLVVLPQQLAAQEDLISRVRQHDEDIPIVVVARHGDVDAASQAVQMGATDFLVLGDRLPERIATLIGKLRGLFDAIVKNRLLSDRNAQLRDAIQARFEIVGESPQVRAMIEQIRLVAEVPRPLLILGERGTGKELVARAIHFIGKSASKPIVTVNCAAFSDSLLESELFGHEKGAFTGADVTRHGKFEQADGGTLFLDEIGNMSLTFQQKILRVVEYGTYTRVGGMHELKSTVRIVAATNCDLQEMIYNGDFLPDLYDRLAFEVISVPPLRERQGDVEVLMHYFATQFEREVPAFRGKRFSKAAIGELNRHSFPGNIRELKNVIERAVYRDTTDEITPSDLGLKSPELPHYQGGTYQEQLDGFARELIEVALQNSGNNQAEAARRLGLTYHQFRHYYRKYLS